MSATTEREPTDALVTDNHHVPRVSDKGKTRFKKRSRPPGGKTRKKLDRNSFSTPSDVQTSGTPDQEEKLKSGGNTNAKTEKESTNRLRERYSVSEKDDKRINQATSSRTDTLTTNDRGEDRPGEKQPTTSNNYGPVRAPSHLRSSIQMDYQPDVCKDYKETGYCGFGDSCKFLHDRSDYKAGWQLQKSWNDKQQQMHLNQLYNNMHNGSKSELSNNENDTDGLPFACFICRNDFTNPVITLCNHYFCEACAIDHMAKKHTCPICGKQMRNTLNVAHKLIEKLKNT